MNSKYFPTDFAIKMARDIKLYTRRNIYDLDPEHENAKKAKRARKAIDLHERLESFQSLAITGDFEEAIVAYEGIDLDDEEKEVLGVIHASTSTWARGFLVEKILNQISEVKSGRDMKELAHTMMMVMGIDEDNKTVERGIEALIIKTTGDNK